MHLIIAAYRIINDGYGIDAFFPCNVIVQLNNVKRVMWYQTWPKTVYCIDVDSLILDMVEKVAAKDLF